MSHRPYIGGRVQLRARPNQTGTGVEKLDGFRYGIIWNTTLHKTVELKRAIRPLH